MPRFEELEVWKRSARLSANLYKTMTDLKDFGFRDQITRAGLSIPSNIAEGYERNSDKELANFLNYAKGSDETTSHLTSPPKYAGQVIGYAGELRTQVYIGMEIGYIKNEIGKGWLDECEEISKMLHGLIRTVRARIK
jgi:hypothetical protein